MSDPGSLAAPPPTLNVPNALSAARIALVPVLLVVLVAQPHGSLLAAGLFALASATDVLDGHLARTRGLITDLGKVLDPLADKLMVVSVLVALVVLERVALWVVLVILAREVAVSVLRARAARRGADVAARPLGKAKMGLQIATVIALLAAADPTGATVEALVHVTVAVTVASGVDCAVHLRRRPPAA